MSLGGNHWSEFAASGNPGVVPYKRFIYDAVHGIDLQGPYTDRFPFTNEHLGRSYSVTVRAPAAGQIVAAGTRKTIRWQAEGCVLADLYYKPSASSAVLIVENYPNVGFYMWEVPSGLVAGSYTVHIDCKDSTGGFPGAAGDSDAFTVGTNALALLTPGRDFRATNGGTLRVSWRASGVAGGGVNVFVQKAGGAAIQVATGVTGTSTVVTLPASVNSSNDVIVRIQAAGNANQQDAVDGYVMVRGASGSFQPSLAGSVFTIGSAQILRWVGPSSSTTLDLDLIERFWTQPIARNLPDFGNFTWLVPVLSSSGANAPRGPSRTRTGPCSPPRTATPPSCTHRTASSPSHPAGWPTRAMRPARRAAPHSPPTRPARSRSPGSAAFRPRLLPSPST